MYHRSITYCKLLPSVIISGGKKDHKIKYIPPHNLVIKNKTLHLCFLLFTQNSCMLDNFLFTQTSQLQVRPLSHKAVKNACTRKTQRYLPRSHSHDVVFYAWFYQNFCVIVRIGSLVFVNCVNKWLLRVEKIRL